MGMLPNIGYPQTGETVEPGNYACMNCPHNKSNDDSTVIIKRKGKLPLCPVCGYTYWMKY